MARVRTLLSAVLFATFAAQVFADTSDDFVARDPHRPAVGEWIGQVSWNEPIISYSWAINPDGTFTSGRLGRGHDGIGAWSTNGDRLTLKYGDGFRYEGELRGDAYDGAAYLANGRVFGGFSMRRDGKHLTEVDE